ncbi:MAG: hypothetical protein IKC04_07280 [Oscillospiraceae bacterium]|nr:hypothetical protein [Oscillospiraceae bacterium]
MICRWHIRAAAGPSRSETVAERSEDGEGKLRSRKVSPSPQSVSNSPAVDFASKICYDPLVCSEGRSFIGNDEPDKAAG